MVEEDTWPTDKKKEEVIPDVNEDTWPTEIEDQLTAKKKQEKNF